MIWEGVPVTRRHMMRGLIYAGAFVAEAHFKLTQAREVTARQEWTGFSTSPLWQPFSLVTGDTIILSIDVAGLSVGAIIDSGSAASIISSSLATKLGLSPTEKRTVRGVSGRASALLARNIEIKFGGERRRLPSVFIADLKAVSSALGRPVEMVLGEDMLAERCVAFDFANRRLSVGATGGFAGEKGWERVSLIHGSNRELLVDASVMDLANMPMIFDLGSSTALMLAPSYVSDHRLLQGVRQSTAAIGGIDGITSATTFITDRVKLGKVPIRAAPTLSPTTWLSTSAVGSIGLPLIAQFDVVLDVSAGQLWLRPAQRGLPMLEDHSGFGLALTKDELHVVHVAKNSPAAQSGWGVGDGILAINGRDIDSSYTFDHHWRWRFMKPGTIVALKDHLGRTRDLCLADYY